MNITLQEAGAKLLSAEKIIITAHINPDGDALGSSLGLYHVLKDMGKSVEVIIDDLEFCRDVILENKDKIHFEEYDDFYIYFSKNIRVLNEMKNDLVENNTKMNYLKMI